MGQPISKVNMLIHNLGHELEEMKICVQTQSSVVGNVETWWDHSCDRSAAKDGYRL